MLVLSLIVICMIVAKVAFELGYRAGRESVRVWMRRVNA